MGNRTFIVGNWKMHKGPSEAGDYLRSILPDLTAAARVCDVAVAPTFLFLREAGRILDGSPVGLAAQDGHWEEEGPFTGEVAAKMLREAGCSHVIVGHSERREHFGDTDRRVNRKARAVLFWGMTPIICVGEKADERAAGRAGEVVDAQLRRALANIRLGEEQRLVVAYEPVWAIGTGRNATVAEAVEMHGRIRAELAQAFGEERAESLRILYGGSVTPANAGDLLSARGIDGALVGGASLDGASFLAICRAAGGRKDR